MSVTRPSARAAAAVLAIVAAVLGIVPWLDPVRLREFAGIDFAIYRDAAARWLDGGSFYLAHQLAGPYELAHGDVLYPPVSLVLFAPFVVLPAILWYAVPIGVTGWAVWRLRPAPWSWPLLGLCVFWPVTVHRIVTGNPVMWIVAALALGAHFGGPSPIALIKPTLAPFALIGIRRRAWWMGLAVLALASIPFGAMWFDWLRVVTNAQQPFGLLYSWWEVPAVLIPVIASVARVQSEHLRSG